jgi:hypothetical protein
MSSESLLILSITSPEKFDIESGQREAMVIGYIALLFLLIII